MHRVIFIALLLLLLAVPLIVPSTPATAQREDTWQDGCDPKARELLDPTNTVHNFDLDAACESWHACEPYENGNRVCQMPAAEVLWDQCPPDGALCQQSALLYAAAIHTGGQDHGLWLDLAKMPRWRAVALYKSGDAAGVRMLFAAGGIREFLARSSLLRRLLQRDAALLDRHKAESSALDAARCA